MSVILSQTVAGGAWDTLGRRLIKSAPWRKRAKGFLIERRPPFIRVTSYVIVWAFISEKALP